MCDQKKPRVALSTFLRDAHYMLDSRNPPKVYQDVESDLLSKPCPVCDAGSGQECASWQAVMLGRAKRRYHAKRFADVTREHADALRRHFIEWLRARDTPPSGLRRADEAEQQMNARGKR